MAEVWLGDSFRSTFDRYELPDGIRLQTVELGNGISIAADGMVITGEGVWQSHNFNREIYLWEISDNNASPLKTITRDGTLSDSDLNNMTLQDLALDPDGQHLWLADSATGRLNKFAIPSGSLSSDSPVDFVTTDSFVGGCTYHNGLLWITVRGYQDFEDDYVMTIDPQTGDITPKFAPPESSPSMWWLDYKNDFLWGGSDQFQGFWKIDPSTGVAEEFFQVSGSFIDWEDPLDGDPVGIWVVDETPEPEAPPFKPLRIIQRWSQQGKSYS